MTTRATFSGEVAAERVRSCRKAFAKLRRRWADGERSRTLLREISDVTKRLAATLDRLDCAPRPIWSSLLAQCRALEEGLVEALRNEGIKGTTAARAHGRRPVSSDARTSLLRPQKSTS